MSDDPSGADYRRPLLERLAALLLRVPEDREQLLELLRQAHERALLDADAMSMIEGVLQVCELTARDIMIPRAEMDVIDVSETPDRFLPKVVDTARSRFPVIDGDRDNVVGILHAKELLRLYSAEPVTLRQLLRPPVFVPESKRLNLLLHDFRTHRVHLAIVVDEYGGTAGLVTIEDVLEQIVGDIDDESRLPLEEEGDIVRVEPAANGAPRHRVRASTRIETFNEILGTHFPDACENVGALLAGHLGRPPRRGERIEIGGMRFEVLRADANQALLLRVQRLHDASHPLRIAHDASNPAPGMPFGAHTLTDRSARAARIDSRSRATFAGGH